MMKAAVFYGPKQPLVIEDVEIDKPLDREVLVRTVASGVCHSDLHFVDGYYSFPAPAVLGHEGAGIVEAVGAGRPRHRLPLGFLRLLRRLHVGPSQPLHQPRGDPEAQGREAAAFAQGPADAPVCRPFNLRREDAGA